jgi:hypothetical protein
MRATLHHDCGLRRVGLTAIAAGLYTLPVSCLSGHSSTEVGMYVFESRNHSLTNPIINDQRGVPNRANGVADW